MSIEDSGGTESDPPAPDREPSIAEAVQEISERAVSLIQEEIELAKAEISEKFNKLLVGAVITAAAAVFVFWAIAIILFGFAYLAHDVGPWGATKFYWGFFLVGGILIAIAVVAGLVAFRFFKAGSPPLPEMAIEEAQRIRETVMPGSAGGDKLPYDPPVYKGSKLDDESPPPAEQDPSDQGKID